MSSSRVSRPRWPSSRRLCGRKRPGWRRSSAGGSCSRTLSAASSSRRLSSAARTAAPSCRWTSWSSSARLIAATPRATRPSCTRPCRSWKLAGRRCRRCGGRPPRRLPAAMRRAGGRASLCRPRGCCAPRSRGAPRTPSPPSRPPPPPPPPGTPSGWRGSRAASWTWRGSSTLAARGPPSPLQRRRSARRRGGGRRRCRRRAMRRL
mmetsp:Transcript_13705/g.34467  ORF Transcript_13705/g.34467 Transcript_13705/m.34467 type:complete len:206 (+) Transcript_13705:145-762(+)